MLARLLVRAALVAALAVVVLPPAGASAAPSPARKMVSLARAELARGVREVPAGSNRGPRIRMYGQSTTPRFYPAPWCAYFVSWLSRRAGRPLGPSGQGFGYVPYIRAWATRTGRWKRTPRSGDLVMFPQHVGMVESVYRNGTLTTIEGNSSNRVARRWRRWGEASGYVRVATGGAVEAPGRRAVPRPRPKVADKLVARISVYPSTTVAVGQAVGFSANDSGGDIASYRWDLDGDGRYDDARGDNAERTYKRAGDVVAGLRVRDRRGRTKTAKVTVNVRVNRAPEAVLDLPRTAAINSEVVASAEESTDADGRIVKVEWDMDGDGVWEAGATERRHTYRRPGVHTVGLRVTDDQGAMTEKVGTIEITQKAPVAKASAPSSVALGADAMLDGSRSYDGDGGVTAWGWDVDGDGTIDAEGMKVPWRFATPGARQVRLVVRDAWGAESAAFVSVSVVNQAPSPVVALASHAIAGEETIFDGTRSADADGGVVAWEWDFDADGRWDATGPQPRWRFTGDGSRKVRLRVTDQWGAARTTEVTVRLLQMPVAAAAVATADPIAGSPVTFSSSAAHDPDGELERLEWDFASDGRVDATTTRPWRTVQAVFTRPGTYTVTLTVVDADGLRASVKLPVVVR